MAWVQMVDLWQRKPYIMLKTQLIYLDSKIIMQTEKIK